MKNILTFIVLLFTITINAQFEPIPTDSVNVQLGNYNLDMTLQDAYDIIDTFPNLILYERREYITNDIIGFEIHEHDIFIEPIDLIEY